MLSNKIVDLLILFAKYHIFHFRTKNCSPLIQVVLRTVTDLLSKSTMHLEMRIQLSFFALC